MISSPSKDALGLPRGTKLNFDRIQSRTLIITNEKPNDVSRKVTQFFTRKYGPDFLEALSLLFICVGFNTNILANDLNPRFFFIVMFVYWESFKYANREN